MIRDVGARRRREGRAAYALRLHLLMSGHCTIPDNASDPQGGGVHRLADSCPVETTYSAAEANVSMSKSLRVISIYKIFF